MERKGDPETLNQRVIGSSPIAPTNLSCFNVHAVSSGCLGTSVMRVLLAIALIASALLASGLAAGPALAQDIKGQGRVIDGLRLWVGHTKVRLCGLTSAVTPAMLGRDGAPLKSLGDLTQHKTVECVRVGSGTPCDGRMPVVDYGHVVAQCFVDGADVVSLLVCFGNRQPGIELAGRHYDRYLQAMPDSRSACGQLR